MQAIIFKKLLPVPMAVTSLVVTDVAAETFAAISYSDYVAGDPKPFGFGCSTYSNYVSLTGNVINYAEIISAT